MSKNENIIICPKCGYKRTEDDNEYVSLEECPRCGIIYNKIKLKQIPPEDPPEQVAEPIDIKDRVLCGDGCCIGIIGKDGLCTSCGKTLEETSSDSENIEEENECEEKLINCEVCKKEISINAISCPHCGEPKKQEQDIPTSLKSYSPDKENKNKLSPGCLIALVIFVLLALFSQNDNDNNTSRSYNTGTNYEQSSCYSLGYKFGKCAAQVMYNDEPCAPSDDIVIPIRCRGKDETQEGIAAGTKFVYRRHQ